MSKPWLSHAARQFREQVDDNFPNRDRRSDGWIADANHSSRSDHSPRRNGVVRAIDIDANLGKRDGSWQLADQTRLAAKNGEKRIKYVIHQGKIASRLFGWKWRPYTGQNRHDSHIHISFTRKGDRDGSFFKTIPLIG
jgi:hypothetical protein